MDVLQVVKDFLLVLVPGLGQMFLVTLDEPNKVFERCQLDNVPKPPHLQLRESALVQDPQLFQNCGFPGSRSA